MPLKTCMYVTVILTFEFVHVHICQRSVGWPFKWKLDYSQYLFPLIFAFFPSRQTLTLLPLNNTWLINKPGKHFYHTQSPKNFSSSVLFWNHIRLELFHLLPVFSNFNTFPWKIATCSEKTAKENVYKTKGCGKMLEKSLRRNGSFFPFVKK